MQARPSESATTTVRPIAAFPLKMHLIVWGVFALLCLTLLLLFMQYREVNVWEHWRESGGLRNPSYSERIYESSIFRTRANTWSNMAFVLVGLYAIALAYLDRKQTGMHTGNYLRSTPAMSLLFGVGCCYLGFASGLMHASLTRWGQQLDVASMYAPLLALIAINIGRYRPRFTEKGPPTWPLLIVIAVVISSLLYVYKWQMSSVQVLSTLILQVGAFCILDLVLRSPLKARWYLLSFLALALAIYCRQTDVRGEFTGPDAWLQGHAIWHVLCAVCLGCIYLYYRSAPRDHRNGDDLPKPASKAID